MQRNHRLIQAASATAVAAAAMAAAPASAATLEVQFTGLDLFLGFDDDFNIQTGPTAGTIDELEAATFFVDDVEIGTIVGDITANVGLPGFLIPAAGGITENLQPTGYFSLDFDTTSSEQGFLDLDVQGASLVEVFYTGDEIGLSLIGRASAIQFQQPLTDRLPAWPGFGDFETIVFSFVSTDLSDVEDNGHELTQFRASGSGTLNGPAIPEPASLTAIAGAGILALRRRR